MVDSRDFINMAPGTQLRVTTKDGGKIVLGKIHGVRSSQGFTDKSDDEMDLKVKLPAEGDKPERTEIETVRMADIKGYEILDGSYDR